MVGSVDNIKSESIYHGFNEQWIPVEGVMGLSWNEEDELNEYTSPILNILQALQVDERIYTLWLGRFVFLLLM